MEIFKFKGFYHFWNFYYIIKQNQYFSLSLFFRQAIFNTCRLSISPLGCSIVVHPFSFACPWMMNKLKTVHLILQSFSFIYHIHFFFILFFKRAIFNLIHLFPPRKQCSPKETLSLSFNSLLYILCFYL